MAVTEPRDDFGGGWRPAPGELIPDTGHRGCDWLSDPAPGTTTAAAGRWTIGQGPPPRTGTGGMPTGWKCGDCGTVMAPWRSEHRCPDDTPPAAAATAVLYKTDPS